jgi:hypothetical protein
VECNDRLPSRNPNVRNSATPLPKMPRAHEACAQLAGATGFELKRFDCSECDHVEQIAIPSDDPMKSDAVGWFIGELQPPK